ncbi:hypothetical protein llap_431 [Limosa lapponica baueri]|uniref:Uncharacterized protein n=1 Tax=Limosa lapponica baueri TaxID=1758121 RepID=A0A2I0UT90_LIMLA|nr:hypothetical protein llap_431 [Limosa lapponica baueri]
MGKSKRWKAGPISQSVLEVQISEKKNMLLCGGLEEMTFKDPFQPKPFYDSIWKNIWIPPNNDEWDF